MLIHILLYVQKVSEQFCIKWSFHSLQVFMELILIHGAALPFILFFNSKIVNLAVISFWLYWLINVTMSSTLLTKISKVFISPLKHGTNYNTSRISLFKFAKLFAAAVDIFSFNYLIKTKSSNFNCCKIKLCLQNN